MLKSYCKHKATVTKKEDRIGKGHEVTDHDIVIGEKISDHIYKIDESSALLENKQAHNSCIVFVECEVEKSPEPISEDVIAEAPAVEAPIVEAAPEPISEAEVAPETEATEVNKTGKKSTKK